LTIVRRQSSCHGTTVLRSFPVVSHRFPHALDTILSISDRDYILRYVPCIIIRRCPKLSTTPSTSMTSPNRRRKEVHVFGSSHHHEGTYRLPPSCPGGCPPRPDQDQASQAVPELDFRDSSGPLFSMYLKLAEEEDIKIVERWRTDARGILVFVSPHMSILCYTDRTHQPPIIDGFVLCRCCSISRGINAGPQARPTGYIRVLSRENLSGPRQLQRIPR